MADTISTRDILAPFQTVSALNELNDFFLLQANRTVGGDGSQAAVRISAQLVKAYLMNGFSITVNNEGYIVIGGEKTHTKIITELAPRVVAQTRRSVSIAPNVLNKWGKVPSLSITSLRPGPSGYANEYMLEFVASGDNFSLLLPRYVQWREEPEWEDGYTYQVSIVNNLAVYAGWEPSEESSSSSDIGSSSSSDIGSSSSSDLDSGSSSDIISSPDSGSDSNSSSSGSDSSSDIGSSSSSDSGADAAGSSSSDGQLSN